MGYGGESMRGLKMESESCDDLPGLVRSRAEQGVIGETVPLLGSCYSDQAASRWGTATRRGNQRRKLKSDTAARIQRRSHVRIGIRVVGRRIRHLEPKILFASLLTLPIDVYMSECTIHAECEN
jgi:hypothetical protein